MEIIEERRRRYLYQMLKLELIKIISDKNIKIESGSGKKGKVIKDYLAAIETEENKDELFFLKAVIPCEWLLVGKTHKCCIASACGERYCSLHWGRIKQGKRIPTACKRCEKGTKASTKFCTRCANKVLINRYKRLKVVEGKARRNYNLVMKELLERNFFIDYKL